MSIGETICLSVIVAFFALITGVILGGNVGREIGAIKAHAGLIKCALVQNQDKTTRWQCVSMQ